MLFAIAGSTGAGKTTIIKRVIEKMGRENISSFATCTTRTPRPGEFDGKDYHFMTKRDFDTFVQIKDIIEAKKVYGNIYGTNIKVMLDMLEVSKVLIKDFDVEGYKNVINRVYYSLEERNLPLFPIVTILIDTDDKTLIERATSRKDGTDVASRAKELQRERILKESNSYDYRVDSSCGVEECANKVCEIINQEYKKYHGTILCDVGSATETKQESKQIPSKTQETKPHNEQKQQASITSIQEEMML